jgi:hypothetical protein
VPFNTVAIAFLSLSATTITILPLDIMFTPYFKMLRK